MSRMSIGEHRRVYRPVAAPQSGVNVARPMAMLMGVAKQAMSTLLVRGSRGARFRMRIAGACYQTRCHSRRLDSLVSTLSSDFLLLNMASLQLRPYPRGLSNSTRSRLASSAKARRVQTWRGKTTQAGKPEAKAQVSGAEQETLGWQEYLAIRKRKRRWETVRLTLVLDV